MKETTRQKNWIKWYHERLTAQHALEVIVYLLSNVFSFIINYTFTSYLFLRFPGTVFVSFTHCALWEIWRFSPQRTNKRQVPYLPLLVIRLKICKNSLLKEIFETFKAILSVSFQLTYWHVHNIDGRTPWENLRVVLMHKHKHKSTYAGAVRCW